MGRLGIFPTDMSTFLDTVSGLPGIKIVGIMNHFADSDNPVSKSTVQSFKASADTSRELKNRFAGIRHIANSGAVLNFPDTYCDMVRAGIALYGYHPTGRVDRDAENLIPAMSFVS